MLPLFLHDDPIIIIWEKNSLWHLIFRSKKKSGFSGMILTGRRLENVKKQWFEKRDLLRFSEKKIQLKAA